MMSRRNINVLLHPVVFFLTFGLLLFYVPADVDAKIVFCIGTELYVMNDDGSGRRKLTDNATTDDSHPRWSPDGRQIVFSRDMKKDRMHSAELFIINADGTDLQRLTHNNTIDAYPSWSPDGQHIAFAGAREVHVMDLATRAVRQLTFAVEHEGSTAPDFSPDGRQITFERFSGIPKGGGVGFVGKTIYVMSAEGQHQRPLQAWRGDAASTLQFEPRFSPDGQRVLFDDCKWQGGEDFVCRLTVSRIGGAGQVIDDIYNRIGDNFLVSYAGWMQNGRAILFAVKRLETPTPNYDLYRYAFDTRSLRRLTRDPRDESYADWTEGALSVSAAKKMTTLWGEIKQLNLTD